LSYCNDHGSDDDNYITFFNLPRPATATAAATATTTTATA